MMVQRYALTSGEMGSAGGQTLIAVGLTVVTLVAARSLGEAGEPAEGGPDPDANLAGGDGGMKHELRFWQSLGRERAARTFLVANVLWNAGVEGVRPYLFLFATVALGITVATASLAMIGFLIAAGIGSVVVGRLGDRYGRPRILFLGALLAGTAMLPGLFVRDLLALIVLLVPAGFGAAALVSLPYAVFEDMVDDDDVGRSTGAFYMSVGLARVVAPLVVGAAIDTARSWMPGTEGFPIMWPVAGSLVLLGAFVLRLPTRRRTSIGADG